MTTANRWSSVVAALATGMLALSAAAQPANDNCLTPTVITAPSTVQGSNVGAFGDNLSSCAGPNDTNDVWFRLTAPTTGIYTFNTLGSPFDTTLSAFDGCNGAELGCNDDSAGTFQSTLSINLAAGQVGLIRVAGYNNASGTFTLATSAVLIPQGNDACSGATVLLPGGSLQSTNVGASGTNLSSCAGDGDTLDVWFRFTANQSGVHVFDTLGTAGLDTTLAVFDSCGGAELVCDDDDPISGTLLSRVQLTLNSGQTYFIRVAGYAGASGGFTLNSRLPATPAANDNCASAIHVVLPYAYTADISASNNDLDTSCNDPAASETSNGVWFSYTPPVNQLIRFHETSGIGTVIAVFTGSCASLSENSCSDTGDSVRTLTAGTAYLVLVGAYDAAGAPLGAPIQFSMTEVVPPTNDTCDTARIIAAVPFTETVDISTASGDADVGCNDPANVETRNGVWYSFTPSVNGLATFNETSDNDVVFAVFNTPCASGQPEVYCTGAEPSAPFRMNAGTTYRILIGLFFADDTPTAPVSFNLTYIAAPGACCVGSNCSIVTSALACTALGGAFRGPGVACGEPQAVNTSGTPIPEFPDGGPAMPVQLDVTVAGSFNVSTVSVIANLTHTWAGDLNLRLQGPNGAQVDLLVRPGALACAPGAIGNPNDLDGEYVFDDNAAQTLHAAVLAGPSPIAPGRYKPSGCNGAAVSLSAAFAGIPAAGTWSLIVSDEDEGITGDLHSFAIVINGGLNQPCSSAQGACCSNTACVLISGASCTGPGKRFIGAGAACNAPGVVNAPCCRADTNQDSTIALQDLFDFLILWFARDPGGDANDVGGVTVQDIFDYLRAYFTHCQ